jgi:2-phosphosulfolactate phosphatase
VITVTRTSLYEGARDATGTAVIIDVYRAFTTAAFCIAAGAREVVLTASHGAALKMKAKDPTLFLTGEIGGKPIPGFDVGNSPSKIEGLDLTGRRVVQRTSAGTQGVVAAANAARIMLGSFVIAGATARYIADLGGEVTLVAMGQDGAIKAPEDELCATYLEAVLAGKEPPVVPTLMHSSDRADWPEWFPERDALLACEVDRFDFALPVTREDGLLIARPVHTS